MLLVSGYGAKMGDWGDLPTRLGATARTCMYDRLGVDRSDSPPPVQTFQDIAADLDGVIRHCGCPGRSCSSRRISVGPSPSPGPRTTGPTPGHWCC